MPIDLKMERLGASITKAASLQTYYTVRFLVDRDLVWDAYQAYAYFRWVDDWLDEPTRQKSERLAFVERQTALIDDCYSRKYISAATAEEDMLIALIQKDGEKSSGLQSYIRSMMTVMAFDAERRGRLVSAEELNRYAGGLARAVTEALHYFIGHGRPAPHGSARYLAAEGAHITHMLRDTLEDNELGYFNIPREYVAANGISPFDTDSDIYRAWVRSRVQLARSYFRQGRGYLAQVASLRCRLAGYAYMARFETVLDSIEGDNYRLRPDYREAKSPRAGAQMGWSIFWAAFKDHPSTASRDAVTVR
jgi:squalene/phytoene synthase